MTLTGIAEFIASFFGLPGSSSVWIVAVLAAAILLGFMLLTVLILIYVLRKLLGKIQARLGPTRTGPKGIFQTAADALKLLIKEDTIPVKADRRVFIVAPILVFVPAYLVYVVVPFGEGNHFIAKDLNIGLLYIVAVSSINVIGVVLAGWASENKYSLLGGMRSAAQLISYEVPQALAVLGPVMLAESLSMQDIVKAQGEGLFSWFIFRSLPLLGFIVFLVASMAEINHVPFDLPEGESELVAGFNVEYSGMRFAFFMLAEFAASFTICAIAATLFLGGWHSPIRGFLDNGWWTVFWFFLKSSALVCLLMWIRATYPRVRVDQLMEFGWKLMIPLALFNVLVVGLYVALGKGG